MSAHLNKLGGEENFHKPVISAGQLKMWRLYLMTDKPKRTIPEALLTPTDVAELLQISEKTVYKHSREFFGFKPAGLGILRFRKEIIYGIMEGQDPKALVLQFPVSERNLCGERVQNEKRSGDGKGREKKRTKESTTKSNRHGIFGGV